MRQWEGIVMGGIEEELEGRKRGRLDRIILYTYMKFSNRKLRRKVLEKVRSCAPYSMTVRFNSIRFSSEMVIMNF